MNDKIEVFCSIPWEDLIIYADGGYSVCTSSERIDYANESNSHLMWNSEAVRNHRANILEGKREGVCKKCSYKTINNATPYGKEIEKTTFLKNPKTIAISPTEKCNLNCFMCGFTRKYHGKNRMAEGEELSVSFMENLAESYFSDLETLNSNCAGEIFLYTYLLDFIRILKEFKPKTVITSTSGSVMVGERTWEEVLSVHDKISFSVDSFDRNLHQTIRGFDIGKLLKNLEIVREIKKNNKIELGFNAVIMKMTIPGLFDFVQRAVEDHGAEFISFQNVFDFESESFSKEKRWRIFYNNQIK